MSGTCPVEVGDFITNGAALFTGEGYELSRVAEIAPKRFGGSVRISSPGKVDGWAQWFYIKKAVVGRTVCVQPYGTHWCGLTHVSPKWLEALPRVET